MPKIVNLTPLLKAISFAARKHKNQLRKDEETPYVAHPMRVSTILTQEFGVRDPDILCTALLHDTIEDTTTDRDDLKKEFGEKIAGWVALLTKDKRLDEEARERAYFQQLAEACWEVKLCKLGDTLDNLIDCASLPRDKQQKAIGKAKHLLELFEPTLPEEGKPVMERMRRAVREAEDICRK